MNQILSKKNVSIRRLNNFLSWFALLRNALIVPLLFLSTISVNEKIYLLRALFLGLSFVQARPAAAAPWAFNFCVICARVSWRDIGSVLARAYQTIAHRHTDTHTDTGL